MKKFNWLHFIYIVGALFLLINMFWVIYAFAKYGNCPISEIPAWAIYYMFWRK